jgi:hypothetical protein
MAELLLTILEPFLELFARMWEGLIDRPTALNPGAAEAEIEGEED